MTDPTTRLAPLLAAAALVVAGCGRSGSKAAPGTTAVGSRGGLTTPATLADGSFPPVDSPHHSGALARVRVKLTQVANVASPTVLAARPGHADQLFIAERAGQVLLARPATASSPFTVDSTHPLLDISSQVGTDGEEGLLGLAFDRTGNTLYVSYDLKSNDSRLVSYRVGGAGAAPIIEPASATTILAVDQPDETNHKGGDVQLGPDGYLYWGLGDGGNEDDPNQIGQNATTLLAKILRIDPTHPSGGKAYGIPRTNPFADGKGGLPETFISGVRNPWRFSFDPATGDLWIGDVGQDKVEEIDRIPAGKGAGANLGWSGYEGTHVYKSDRRPTRSVPPLYEALHSSGVCAITGGVVYRGEAIAGLRGAYVWGDFCAFGLDALRSDASTTSEGTVTDESPLAGTKSARQVESIGTDAAGEVYALSLTGTIWRLDPA